MKAQAVIFSTTFVGTVRKLKIPLCGYLIEIQPLSALRSRNERVLYIMLSAKAVHPVDLKQSAPSSSVGFPDNRFVYHSIGIG